MRRPTSVAAGSAVTAVRRLAQRVVRFLLPTDAELAFDLRTDLAYLVILLALILLPFAVRFDPAAPGGGAAPTFFGFGLPPLCLSRQLFGVECPGCGLTRSFVLFVHGRVAESFRYHRLGIPLYVLFASQALFRCWRLARPSRPVPRFLVPAQRFVPAVLIVLLILNWLANLF